jgi:hypothetical protein
MFDSVEHKRQYILEQRKKRANRVAICTECLLPFDYRTHSPSMFLCAECYDDEYKTKYAKTKEWHRWIATLRMAGIPAEAHRKMKRRAVDIRKRDMDARLEVLIDEYSYILNTDGEFAEHLVMA